MNNKEEQKDNTDSYKANNHNYHIRVDINKARDFEEHEVCYAVTALMAALSGEHGYLSFEVLSED
mgnify:CR=1 FL=1